MIPKYPDDSIQAYIEPWWISDDTREFSRGRLVYAYIPFIDQVPYRLISEGRENPTEHKTAQVKIEPLRISAKIPRHHLPVAGIPQYEKEELIVYRAKRRPCIVLGFLFPELPKYLQIGRPRWQVKQALLVAPFYGTEQNGSRAGYPKPFVDSIRRAAYPFFFWDVLPPYKSGESFLRLDQIQPLGCHHDSLEWTQYRLCNDALIIMDEWMTWVFTGKLSKDGILGDIRKGINAFLAP